MKRTKFLLTFICLLSVASTFAQKVNGIALKDLDAEYIEVKDEMLFGMKVQFRFFESTYIAFDQVKNTFVAIEKNI